MPAHCTERKVLRELSFGRYLLVEAFYPAGCVDPFHEHRFSHASIVLEGSAVELRRDHFTQLHRAGSIAAQAERESHALCFLEPARVLTVVMPRLDAQILRREGSTEVRQPIATPGFLRALVPRVFAALAAPDERRPPWLDEVLRTFAWASAVPIRRAVLQSGVHHAHFDRVFKRCVGMSPRAFRRAAKVRKASALLIESGAPLVEVAARAGFSDQSHMTAAFRGVTGLTPRRYRSVFAHTAHKTH